MIAPTPALLRRLATLAVVAPTVAGLVRPARADGTTDYVVKAGDTCYRIATRELGDRDQLDELHALNPQLGPLPHKLVPGQILKLPARIVEPDAHLTGAAGVVQVRKPADSVWDLARRGMELFRAWRVGAQDRSSAEVTFRDADRLQLRENTIVIIYGPERDRARVAPAQAVIEQGTLRTRLAELSPTIKVTTPTAVATVGAGSALVGVAADGGSLVANHEGKPVELAGKAGGKVKVTSNMGTRVARGKPPEKPRPLPPPPAWDDARPLGFAALGADGATVIAGWKAEPKAAWYRLEVLAPSGTVVASAEVPSNVTRFELVRVPVGDYQARIASIDVDRLEGRPGPLRAITVLPVAIVPPGADRPAPVAAAPDTSADGDRRIDAGGAAPPPPVAARGASVGDAGLRCAVADGAGEVAHLDALGRLDVRCTTAAGLAVAPFAVEVVGVTATIADAGERVTIERGAARPLAIDLASGAPLGDRWRVEADPGLRLEDTAARADGVDVTVHATADAPAEAAVRIVDAVDGRAIAAVTVTVTEPPAPPPTEEPPPPPVRHDRVWAVSGLVGWTHVPTGPIEGFGLGDAPIAAYQLTSGASVGLRATRWFDRDLFAEAELRAVSAEYADAGAAWLAGGHAYLGVRLMDWSRLEVRALLGGGGHALLTDSRYTRRDVELDVGWGLTAASPLEGRWWLRLDARQHIAPDRAGGVTDVVEATVGLEAVLDRR